MLYYDIHTHQPPVHPEDIAVIAIDLCDGQNPCAPPFDRHMTPDDRRQKKQPTEKQHTTCYAVGIHPWKPDKNLLPKVRQYALLPSVVAIGETGLDKIKATTQHAWELQVELFAAHIQLAETIQKPLIIHCVKAWDTLLQMHKTHKPVIPWIIHGFRGKTETASQLLHAGLYLSFGTRHQPDALKTAWEHQRLLVETDDKTIDIRHVYQQIACQLTISPQELSKEIETFFHQWIC